MKWDRYHVSLHPTLSRKSHKANKDKTLKAIELAKEIFLFIVRLGFFPDSDMDTFRYIKPRVSNWRSTNYLYTEYLFDPPGSSHIFKDLLGHNQPL